jgi:hypothetical protein
MVGVGVASGVLVGVLVGRGVLVGPPGVSVGRGGRGVLVGPPGVSVGRGGRGVLVGVTGRGVLVGNGVACVMEVVNMQLPTSGRKTVRVTA